MPILKQAEMQHLYLRKKNGDLRLSKKHDYYYQIQGQLNVTGIDKCDLVDFVPPADLVVVFYKEINTSFKVKCCQHFLVSGSRTCCQSL